MASDGAFCKRIGQVACISGERCNGTFLKKGDGVLPTDDEYNVLYQRQCSFLVGQKGVVSVATCLEPTGWNIFRSRVKRVLRLG
jgi:hypothetical protein